jgi:phage terminase large subunit-like protein
VLVVWPTLPQQRPSLGRTGRFLTQRAVQDRRVAGLTKTTSHKPLCEADRARLAQRKASLKRGNPPGGKQIVATIAPKRPETAIKPGINGFLAFCELIDFALEPYMRRIARAYFGKAREVAAILPRGNAKTTLAALIGLHHLLTVRGASVVVGASSRDQARVAFERMESFLAHEALEGMVTIRHLELRFEGQEGIRRLRVVPSDGPRTHGLSCTLYIGDEVWAWAQRADLLTAFTTGLVKRPDSKLLLISTSAGDLDSPLGRLRQRAMAQSDVHRAGPVVESKSRNLHWIEWSLAEHHELDNLRAVLRCNPAPWIGQGDLRRQKESVTEAAFLQFHCCRWGIKESTWLPEGAWAACEGEVEFKPGERIHIGVDVGASRSATAVCWLNSKLHVGVEIFEGEDGIYGATETVMRLAERYSIAAINYDPWRAAMMVKAFEQRRLKCVVWPWTDSRVIPAASELYEAICEGKLTHDGDEELARHMSLVVGKATRRGLRIDKANESDQIDGAAALLMAHESATAPEPPPTKVLGWL